MYHSTQSYKFYRNVILRRVVQFQGWASQHSSDWRTVWTMLDWAWPRRAVALRRCNPAHSMYVCFCIWSLNLGLMLASNISSRRTSTTLSRSNSKSLVWTIASSKWHHWDIAKAFDTIKTVLRLFSILATILSTISRPTNQSLSCRHMRRLYSFSRRGRCVDTQWKSFTQ